MFITLILTTIVKCEASEKREEVYKFLDNYIELAVRQEYKKSGDEADNTLSVSFGFSESFSSGYRIYVHDISNGVYLCDVIFDNGNIFNVAVNYGKGSMEINLIEPAKW